MKLYEIAESFKLMEQLAYEAETDDEFIRFREAMTELEDAFENKVENIAKIYQNTKADIDALKAEENRLNAKRKSAERRLESMKQYLFEMFKVTGTERIKYPQFTVSLRNNAESVNVLDESIIPLAYFTPQAPKLSKSAVKEALQSGESVPGAELVRNQSLQIR
ncbi:siphovirus Gp157 family protein [Aerococcaceae bacterium zg-B36]|uniref:siphovirus Gp157 family protein n=1 Tax=Aerococcaceae bacterium zg-252 TaxID=2796928 RepID=UPI001BD830CC|nr:siphovirus Gp157 family protein [Aerococcaceae bacterium zg-B36]